MSACRRYRPAGGERRISLLRSLSAAFAPNPWARPPGFLALGVTCAFAYATARRTRGHPQDGLSAGFKGSVSFPLAAQATGLWLLPWHRYLLLSTLSISLVARVGARRRRPPSAAPGAFDVCGAIASRLYRWTIASIAVERSWIARAAPDFPTPA